MTIKAAMELYKMNTENIEKTHALLKKLELHIKMSNEGDPMYRSSRGSGYYDLVLNSDEMKTVVHSLVVWKGKLEKELEEEFPITMEDNDHLEELNADNK